MAICNACHQDMLHAERCTANRLITFADGERFKVIPFGFEDGGAFSEEERSNVHCGDCGVRPGGAHHPGCDIEMCPRCRQQRISCDCSAECDGSDTALPESGGEPFP
jgi:hypothetical protein